MKKITVIAAILCSIFSFSQSNNLEIAIKEKIVEEVYLLNDKVTENLLEHLVNELKALSHDSCMCFVSLGVYNNCDEGKNEIYPTITKYLNDLIGKELSVSLTKWNKPWDDENFYTLKFELAYSNDNDAFPVETNFDTLILDISDDKIKNIIYAREWVDLASFLGVS